MLWGKYGALKNDFGQSCGNIKVKNDEHDVTAVQKFVCVCV